MEISPQIPKGILVAINQLFEIEAKIKRYGDNGNLHRNVVKMKDAFRELGFDYDDPMGQSFKETRTDLESTISGEGTENLVIVEVLKPIIRSTFRDSSGEFTKIVQRGVVIVQSKQEA